MKSEELIEKIKKINKAFYTAADISKVSGLSRSSVLVLLNRLAKGGRLIRLRRNCYIFPDKKIDLELIAAQIDPDGYVSFESALARFGILSQIPYSLTMATPNRSKKIKVGEREIIFRKIKKNLKGDIFLENGIQIASAEKALLDMVYLVSRGQSDFNFDELDWRTINKKKLKKLSEKYPKYSQSFLDKLIEINSKKS